MDRKEKVRLMYSQSNGMTSDKTQGIYKHDFTEHNDPEKQRLILQKENLLKIVEQIQSEKRRKLKI